MVKVPFGESNLGYHEGCLDVGTVHGGFIGERKEDVTYMIDKALKHNNHTNNDLFMIIPLYETFKTHYEDENGNEVSKEEVERICYKKTKSEDTPYVISVNARKIVEIH